MPERTRDFRFVCFLTLVVSFCSIVYELIYSQGLTVLYGGTVARYSITIGLYLVSLGLGSFFYNSFRFKNNLVFFWWNELLLSLAGPLGLLGIFLLNTAALKWHLPAFPIFLLSHVPIVVVGVLSGIEIPLLVSLLSEAEKDRFAKILGVDYIGSFVGTVVYSLWLYPEFGLITTAFVVGFLNFFTTVIYTFWRMGKETFYKFLSVIFLLLYLVILFFSNDIQKAILRQYRHAEIVSQQEHYPFKLSSVKVLEEFSTPYQDVTVYEKVFENGETDFCLNLDSHTQLCDSTLEFYHAGLVEVPLLYLKKKDLKVLVLGGGDWIAIHLLLQYPNVAEIDHVDIDKKFVEYMKHHPHYKPIHKDAFRNARVHTQIDDAFSFLRFNAKKYDLILLDLPGLKHDKLSHLYSVEFYHFMRRALKEGGLVSLWSYGATPERRTHYKVLMNTFREAGFKYHLPYDAYLLKDGKTLPAQPFYLLSDREDFKAELSGQASDTMKQTFDRYQDLLWEGIPLFANVRPNTVLRPNYELIIKNG